MIISRQHFDLDKRHVIEKLIIKTPFRIEAIFPNGACFLYFKNAESVLSLPATKMELGFTESVLLNCDQYVVDFLQKAPVATIEAYAVHLYPDVLKNIYKDNLPDLVTNKPVVQFVKKIAADGIIDHYIDSLDFYFEHPDLVNAELLVLKIKELILLLLQTDNFATIGELISGLFSLRQANLKEIIQSHLFSNLSMNELAKLARLSISSFKRQFQHIYNDTPANYLRTKKIEKAMDLLKQSDYTVREICSQIGFNDDTSQFTKVFKKYTRQSPLAFRNSNKQ